MCSDFPAYSYSIMLCKNYPSAFTGSMQADYYGPAFQSTPIKLLTLPITHFFHPPPPRLFSFFLTSIFTQTYKLCNLHQLSGTENHHRQLEEEHPRYTYHLGLFNISSHTHSLWTRFRKEISTDVNFLCPPLIILHTFSRNTIHSEEFLSNA
jgi:hypothetical protein